MPEQAQSFVRLRFITPIKTSLWFRQGRDVAVLLVCTAKKAHSVNQNCKLRSLGSAHDSLLEDSGKPPNTRTSPLRAADYCLLLLNLDSTSYNTTIRSPLVNYLVKRPSDLMTYG